MTLPPVIRIFFAIDLRAAAKERLSAYISSLKKAAKSHAIRWSKPENLHITLQFLPEVKAIHLPILVHHVRKQIETTTLSKPLSFGNLHLFPNPYRPRVIVLEVMPQDELAELSALIATGIKAVDYEVEMRPFRGHLTLGRIKHAKGTQLEFLSACEALQIEAMEINEVTLFRSEPQTSGSKYTVLERLALKGADQL